MKHASRYVVFAALSPPLAAQQSPPLFEELRTVIPHVESDLEASSGAVAFGDVDGDGDLDLIEARRGKNHLFLHDADGVFVDASERLPDEQLVDSAVAMADVDGDGDLDAFFVAGPLFGAQHLRLYLNDGNGSFSDATSQVPIAFSAFTIVPGDLDGDGDVDLFATHGSLTKGLLLNDGTGTFIDASAQLPADAAPTNDCVLGDLDGDGDLDIVFANSNPWENHRSRIWINLGNASFVDLPNALPSSIFAKATAVDAGDVDGDGDLDVVLGLGDYSTQPSPELLYLNSGNGTLTLASALHLPSIPTRTTDIAFADFDNDGDLDVLDASRSYYGEEPSYRLYSNDSSGVFSDAGAVFPDIREFASQIVLGDWDRDGDLDFASGGRRLRMLVNNGDASAFAEANSSLPSGSIEALASAWGDLDGDGDKDFVVAPTKQIFRNNGAGSFSPIVGEPPDPSTEGSPALALGDIDNDGDVDLVVTGSSFIGCASHRLFLNDGTGHFALAQLLGCAGITSDVELGDVDADGDLDLWVAQSEGHGGLGYWDQLFLNESGVFVDATLQLHSELPSNRVALGDLDGDGDLDAVLTGWGGNSSVLLDWNDGAGVFSDVGPQLPVSDPVSDAAVLDVDLDLDLDIFLGCPGQDRLFLNQGAGVFVEGTAHLPPDSDRWLATDVADVDLDGDLDVLTAVETFYPGTMIPVHRPRLLLNNGHGAFADASQLVSKLGDHAASLAFADMDGDSDLDLFVGNYNSGPARAHSQVLTNLTRQVAWRGLPRIGKSLRFDLAGPPAAHWLLIASSASTMLPFPPLGTLWINRDSAILRRAGVFDSEGRAVLDLDPLPFPAALGTTYYWQALVRPPAGLTNLEVTTFTSF